MPSLSKMLVVTVGLFAFVNGSTAATPASDAIAARHRDVVKQTAAPMVPSHSVGLNIRQMSPSVEYSSFPNCSLSCIGQTVTADSCGLQNYACHCSRLPFTKATTLDPCLASKCSSSSDTRLFYALIQKLCESVGVDVSQSLLTPPMTITYSPTAMTSIATQSIASAILSGLTGIYNFTGNETRLSSSSSKTSSTSLLTTGSITGSSSSTSSMTMTSMSSTSASTSSTRSSSSSVSIASSTSSGLAAAPYYAIDTNKGLLAQCVLAAAGYLLGVL